MLEKVAAGIAVSVGILIVVGIISILPWIGAWSYVSAGEVGVVTRMGAVNRVADPGLVIKLPFFIENVHSLETRVQKEQVDASAASQDLQEVKSTIALNFHLEGNKAVTLYQNLGEDYVDRIIAPAMQEAFKATTAKFTAPDLIAKREEVKQISLNELKDRLSKYNILVDDFNIVNFDFSGDFNKAIEDKQVSQQKLEQAKIDKETALTQAEGQANAQKVLKDSGSLTPEYLQFIAVQKWNGVMPLSTGGQSLIQLPAVK